MSALLPAPEAVVGNPPAAVVVLFALLIVHAVCDYALQSEFLSRAKNRHADLSGFFGSRPAPRGLWLNALGAHSLIHAGGVWLVTGSVVLGAIEFLLHAFLDFAKGEGWTSFALDQSLHRICKVLYVALLYAGVGWIAWSPG